VSKQRINPAKTATSCHFIRFPISRSLLVLFWVSPDFSIANRHYLHNSCKTHHKRDAYYGWLVVEGGEYEMFLPIAFGIRPPSDRAGVALRVRDTVAPSASRRCNQCQCREWSGRVCFVLVCFVAVRAGISRWGGQMAAGVAAGDGQQHPYAEGE
jgi:hypothetical protein